jgi:hypothetical protein
MDRGEGADRALGKDAEGLVASPETRGCAGAGRLGGETGDGTSKTTKLTLGPWGNSVKRRRSF